MSFKRRFVGSNEDRNFRIGCKVSSTYCGKCKPSQCLWLMGYAFKPEEKRNLIRYALIGLSGFIGILAERFKHEKENR